MIELETPQQQQAPDPHIDEVHAEGNLSRFEVTPLQEGYGVTLGNSLRRVLLSSLEGAAVTSIQIHGVFHEFSTIENVKEDVTQIVLNVKKLRLRSFAQHALTLKLTKRGAGPVTAADIGTSWRPSCPVPPSSLRTVVASHWDSAGNLRTGRRQQSRRTGWSYRWGVPSSPYRLLSLTKE